MTQVVPVLVEHIVWLMKEEKRALGQLDCDMMMVAFAGQFVDTIVTNAVLKTQARSHSLLVTVTLNSN